jgi:hypothetical protein
MWWWYFDCGVMSWWRVGLHSRWCLLVGCLGAVKQQKRIGLIAETTNSLQLFDSLEKKLELTGILLQKV